MKQQCPKCGNWVEGTEKKSIVKRGIRKGISFIPIVGQIVDNFDSGYQMVSGESIVDKFINKADSQIRDIPYEFKCPNCGFSWESTIDGEEGNLATKEQYMFNQEFEYFVEHSEEIGATGETVNAYLSKLNSVSLTCDAPKSEMYFLAAWVAYMAQDKNRQFIVIAEQNIHKALRLLNDEEYQLFALMVENKQGNRNAEKITRKALALFKNLKTDNMLLKEEYYRDELNNAIQETLQQYKAQKLDENKKYLIKNSIWCVPVLLFFIFKYSVYDPSIWLFSWAPIYIFIIIIVGFAYWQVINKYRTEVSRTNEEWLELMSFDFVGFNWKDLFK